MRHESMYQTNTRTFERESCYSCNTSDALECTHLSSIQKYQQRPRETQRQTCMHVCKNTGQGLGLFYRSNAPARLTELSVLILGGREEKHLIEERKPASWWKQHKCRLEREEGKHSGDDSVKKKNGDSYAECVCVCVFACMCVRVRGLAVSETKCLECRQRVG